MCPISEPKSTSDYVVVVCTCSPTVSKAPFRDFIRPPRLAIAAGVEGREHWGRSVRNRGLGLAKKGASVT